MALAVYFAIKTVGLAIEDEWSLLATGWGAWFLVDMAHVAGLVAAGGAIALAGVGFLAGVV